MTTHTLMTEAAWLRACAAAPEDDTPRLVYADWLEENGQPERAAYIRYHVAGVMPQPPYVPLDTGPDLQWVPPIPYHTRRERADDIEYLNDDGLALTVTFARGLPHRVVVPTVAALVGGECRTCGGTGRVRSGADFAGEELVRCNQCHGEGRTPGLAATIGRLMGRWEGKCHQCGGTKVMLGAGPDKENPKCSRCAGPDKENPKCSRCMGTGKEWVPGGVLGCCTRVGIANREPYHYAHGPVEDWSWWDEDRTSDTDENDRSSLPACVFAIILQMHPSSRSDEGDTDWLEFPTPDLAREALGEAGAVFCRLATAS